MAGTILAERVFLAADQERFAAVSGDRNPIHLDGVAARRTLAGLPIVHGIHALLWALDSLFRTLPGLSPIASIKVNFEKMIYVGAQLQALLVRHDDQRAYIEVIADGTPALRLSLGLGDPPPSEATSLEPLLEPAEPLALTFDQMIDCHGRVRFFSALEDFGRMFPAAAHVLGLPRVAGLACSSFIVGMVCPGLHSIYRGLNLLATPLNERDRDALQFHVAYSDRRFRLVRLAVSGAGWTGSIDAHARPEPTKQPALSTIADRVTPGEFSGKTALVLGGSRGLGELTGKILAAGGAHVILTYSLGEADVRRVQKEITDHGGRCDVMHYDIRGNAEQQLRQLPRNPDQVYYMVTPMINKRQDDGFDKRRFDEFIKFYVTGFHQFDQAMRNIRNDQYTIFFPSSIYVESRPPNMTEYSMAKAAAEILCADMQAVGRPGRIVMRRLPRVATDQTASLFEVASADPIEVMLPIVREVSANPGFTEHTRPTNDD